jgi:hypothetical protein
MEKIINIIALAKIIASAVFSPTGTHPVDTTIRIKGTVTKGEDYDQVQHMKVDQWACIAVLLSKVNDATMASVVREINGVDKDTITRIKKEAQTAMDDLKAPAKVTCSGKVTAKLSYDVVGADGKLEADKTETLETEADTETA